MGIDFGERRIGIAFSDVLGILATGFENYNRVDLKSDLSHLVNLIKTNNVNEVVVGYPYNMDGSISETGKKVDEFVAELLKVINIKIIYVDERLSSQEAEEMLKRYPWQKRKQILDQVSAEIILQSYLNEKGV